MRCKLQIGAAVALVCAACGGSSPSPGFGGGDDGGASSSTSPPPSGQPVGSFGDSGAGASCAHDSDCPTGSHCVVPTGNEGPGVGMCTPVVEGGTPDAAGNPGTDGSSPSGSDAGLPPIDMACMSAPMCNTGLPSVFPPYVPLLPPSVPTNCSNGFELGDAHTCGGGGGGTVSYTIQANTASGSRAITLDVDFATYLEPDGVLITGVDGSGNTYTLLDTCRIQTWTQADPTGGTHRPPDETIRQFRIEVTQGTKQLTFNFGGVVSPMYIQVLGLCDFDLPQFSQARWWQAVP